jgi:hypothetical protein
MLSHNLAVRGTRHNAHFKADPAIVFLTFDQTPDLSDAYGSKG